MICFGPDEGWTLHHGDCLAVLPTLDPVEAVVTDPPYGLEFMGKAWDHGVPGVPYWAAVRDALKPGGHLLAFGGTRTHHRLMVGIEDAGFEIRDVIMWVYGSGFPKSHDVGKGIDKDAGATREVIDRAKGAGSSATNSLGIFAPEYNATTPATDAATQWDGWGTALKPAWEPIIIARNPLEGTNAQNVLAHGVGGLNIDGCRVEHDGSGIWGNHGQHPDRHRVHPGSDGTTLGKDWKRPGSRRHDAGRWPANLIHDGSDEVTRLMPARFFYCAKADQADRNEGVTGRNTHPTVKPLALMRYLVRLVTPPGGTVCDPFMGSGSTGKAADLEGCHFIGIDADLASCKIAAQRRRAQRSLPLAVEA